MKADEVGLLAYCNTHGLTLQTHSAQTLAALPGEFTPSPFVAKTVGVDNVCERSAVASGGTLLTQKYALDGVTVAVALLPYSIDFGSSPSIPRGDLP